MRIERLRHEDLEGVVDRIGGPTADGAPVLLVSLYAGPHYATTSNSFYLARPVTVTGDEIEGGPGTYYSDVQQSVVVYNAGTMIPTAGNNNYLAHRAGGKWVVDFNG